ncbi:hypothetical protein K437DRAFT_241302 [Tilletiaria anomala UBC 951]|uniref:Protein kinase domain-containing protein n=1 Tax=Tilletiaria anomala (strain ATCC 24038 / CBS 436.72 / UBC 951) TaxID=1037660 RepID=A0A066VC75_TILAU|nr:uncharacterized protein K437DRAFT_241302 [Tilletiaria anomala UBC 951]KDN36205.1 hypothetical protein K437DRAFT_241302 [Tilletiaria anomala UBC 951]
MPAFPSPAASSSQPNQRQQYAFNQQQQEKRAHMYSHYHYHHQQKQQQQQKPQQQHPQDAYMNGAPGPSNDASLAVASSSSLTSAVVAASSSTSTATSSRLLASDTADTPSASTTASSTAPSSNTRATINDLLASTGYAFHSASGAAPSQHGAHASHGSSVVSAANMYATSVALEPQLAIPAQGYAAPSNVVNGASAGDGKGAVAGMAEHAGINGNGSDTFATAAASSSSSSSAAVVLGSGGSAQKAGASTSAALPKTAADLLKEGPRDFRIIRDVGDGSFGTVFLADWRSPLPSGTDLSLMQHPSTRPEFSGSRLVAIKKMKKQYRNWAECLTLKELKSLLAIPPHPHIIPLYDAFLLPTTHELHFVFECMEGNLYQLTKSRKGRPLAQGLIATIFRQIVEGLHHIHTHGYFHRDLKPENLLLTTLGLSEYPCPGRTDIIERDVLVIVKIADFGLARETSSIPPFTEYVSTRWYRAPEVLLRARDYSNPVDIWAVGTIMAEIINLRPLFPGSSEVTQVLAICEIMGTPSDDWPSDDRGKRMGGGPWPRGFKMASAVGFQWPQCKPVRLAKLFGSRTPMSLIDCISSLLQYEPKSRLTTAGLMEHPYFERDAKSLRPIASRSIIPKDKIQAAQALGHVVPNLAKIDDESIKQSYRAAAEPPRALPPSHAYSHDERKPKFGSTSPDLAASQTAGGLLPQRQQQDTDETMHVAQPHHAPFYPSAQEQLHVQAGGAKMDATGSQLLSCAPPLGSAQALEQPGLPMQLGDDAPVRVPPMHANGTLLDVQQHAADQRTVYDVDLPLPAQHAGGSASAATSGGGGISPSHSQVGLWASLHASASTIGSAFLGTSSSEHIEQKGNNYGSNETFDSADRRRRKMGKWVSRVFKDRKADELAASDASIRIPQQQQQQQQQQHPYQQHPSVASLVPSMQARDPGSSPYGRGKGYPSAMDSQVYSDGEDNESLYEVLDESLSARVGGPGENVARGRARGVVSKRHVQWTTGEQLDPSKLGSGFMDALVNGSLSEGAGSIGGGGGSESRQSLAGSIATVGDLQHNPRAADTAPFPYADHHTFEPNELAGYERWEREQERRRRQDTAGSCITHRSNDSDPGPHRRQYPSRIQRGNSAVSHGSQPGIMDRRVRGTTGGSTQSDAARSVHSLDQDLIADMRSMFPRDNNSASQHAPARLGTGRQSRGNGSIRAGSASPLHHSVIAGRYHPYCGGGGGGVPSGRPASNGPVTSGVLVASPSHNPYGFARGPDYRTTSSEMITMHRSVLPKRGLSQNDIPPSPQSYELLGHQHPSSQTQPLGPPAPQHPGYAPHQSQLNSPPSRLAPQLEVQELKGPLHYPRADRAGGSAYELLRSLNQLPTTYLGNQAVSSVPTLPSFAEFAAGANILQQDSKMDS